MSVSSLKNKSQKELYEILKINAEEYAAALKQNTELKRELHKAKAKVKNQRAELTNLNSGVKDKRIARLEGMLVAPTDNGITELDSICEEFNCDDDSNLNSLICSVWNKAYFVGIEERIAELEKVNAKLKKEVDKHRAGFVACLTGKQFTVNNLRQQAKGLKFALDNITNPEIVYNEHKRMSKQADELGLE